jgi:HEAT repeat protein
MKRSAGTTVLIVVLVAGGSALLALESPQEKAWGILDAGLKEKSAEGRAKAVRVLGLLPGDVKATQKAEEALGDAKPEVRVAAATALGLMQSKASIPKLVDALRDKEVSVVLAAAHSLDVLKDKRAYEVYYAVLSGERKSRDSLIAEQLKMLKDRKKMAELGFEEGIGFIPFAGIGYSALRALTKDDSSPVRAAAARVLAKDPDARSAKALVEATSDKSWVVRTAALEALALRGDRSLLKEIQPAMDDEKDSVRYSAAAAVIRLGSLGGAAKKAQAGKKA